MSFPGDRKGARVDNNIPEDERQTFGRQSPYATGSTGTPPVSPTVPASAPAFAHPQGPSRNPQDGIPTADMPPSYDEAVQPRAPEDYGDRPYTEGYNDPSTPLVPSMPTPGTQYSTIPIPPIVPSYSPSLSSQSESDPDRASRFNKWSMMFFLVIILLLSLDDDKDSGKSGDDLCDGRWRFTRNLTYFELAPNLDDIKVTMSGMVGHVIVEQAQNDADVHGTTKLIIEGSGADREDVNTINRFVKQDASDNSVMVGITRFPAVKYPDCLRVVVKIIFPAFKTNVRKLKIAVGEGNVTVNLLENQNGNGHGRNRPSIQVQELDSRVITGHSRIRADVPTWIRLGGSVGTITGEVVVGKEMSAAMVDGNVTLNLVQRSENNKMESKVAVANGNIRIGLPTPYEGVFKLQTQEGEVGVQKLDFARTHLTTVTDKYIAGWSSSKSKGPSFASELNLSSRNGHVLLSMARIDV